MGKWKNQNTQIIITSISEKAVQEIIDHMDTNFEFINKNPKPSFDKQRGAWGVQLWLPPKYVTIPKIIDESIATIPEGVEEELLVE